MLHKKETTPPFVSKARKVIDVYEQTTYRMNCFGNITTLSIDLSHNCNHGGPKESKIYPLGHPRRGNHPAQRSWVYRESSQQDQWDTAPLRWREWLLLYGYACPNPGYSSRIAESVIRFACTSQADGAAGVRRRLPSRVQVVLKASLSTHRQHSGSETTSQNSDYCLPVKSKNTEQMKKSLIRVMACCASGWRTSISPTMPSTYSKFNSLSISQTNL